MKVRAACAFPGCGKPTLSHGLCSGHNRQRLDGRPLAPLRGRRPNGTGLTYAERQRQWPGCPRCWGATREAGKSLCRPCLDVVKQQTVQRRARLVSAGLCAFCGASKPADRFACEDCRSYNNQWQRDHRQARQNRKPAEMKEAV